MSKLKGQNLGDTVRHIRFPNHIDEAISRVAKAEHRTITQQIIMLIERDLFGHPAIRKSLGDDDNLG